MNFKQKLVYMFIGCLFTLAGYFLASLGNNEIPNAHAQQNEEQVIDKIVCRELTVVDENGTPIANLKKAEGYYDSSGGGVLILYNLIGKERRETIRLNGSLREGPSLKFYGLSGKETIELGNFHTPSLYFYNRLGGEPLARLVGSKLQLYNESNGSMTVDLNGRHSGLLQLSDNEYENTIFLHSDAFDEGCIMLFNEPGERKRTMQLSSSFLYISNEGKKVLRADVGRKGGGMITTYDKHGHLTGILPR